MKSDNPFAPNKAEKEKEISAPPPSRFIDEKMSDDSDAEMHIDSALKPAGLSNPFWN